MENYENKELLKEAAKQSLESLKDLKPGTDEYTNTEKAAKARRIEWAKFGISCLTFLGTIGTTVYWSICEAGGVAPLSRAMNDGLHEIKRGFTDRK